MPELTPAESAIMNELTAQPIVEKAIKERKSKEPPPKPVKKCDIKDMLPASVAQMIKEFPTNETVRSVVLMHLKHPIPKEHQAFEQIREWIETTFTKEKAPPVENFVDIVINGSEVVSGRCRFSGRRSGDAVVRFTEAELRDLMSGCGSLNQLMNAMSDKVQERGGVGLIENMDTDDDGYEHSDHQIEYGEDGEWDWHARPVREQLTRFLKQHHPETARNWGL